MELWGLSKLSDDGRPSTQTAASAVSVLIVDTNLFLQCRPLPDLPWFELAKGPLATANSAPEHIELLVIDAVQTEIDRLKGDGSGRRARRARAAASLFREALRHYPDPVAVIRENAPRVTLTFPPRLPLGHPRTSGLDPERPDDQLVERTLALSASHTAGEAAPDVRILTQDVGVMLTARRHGARYIEIPETWLLQPEPDDQDKRISALERQLAKLQATGPLLLLEVTDPNGAIVPEGIEREIVKLSPLTDEEIAAIEAEILAAHPKVTSFNAPLAPKLPTGSMIWQPPGQGEIQAYHEAYETWRAALRTCVSGFTDQLNAQASIIELTVTVRNDGTRPAERIRIEFTAHGSVLLAAPRDPDEDPAPSHLIVPRPPAAPSGKYMSRVIADRLGELDRLRATLRPIESPSLAGLTPPPPRDRHAYYWKPHRPWGVTDSWAFECEEFRHGLDPEDFEIRLFVRIKPAHRTQPHRGNLRCRVSASNAPEPITRNVPIDVRVREESAVSVARQWQLAPAPTSKTSST